MKNINDNFITTEVTKVLGRIHFTDEEIQRIEANASKELDKLTDRRNKQAEDLRFQKNKVLDNLKYLSDDKLNLLRTGVFTPLQIMEEEGRLKAMLKDFEEKIADLSDSTQAMLDCVISFSELAKHASIYFPHALDAQKRSIVMQVFSELYIESGELKYTAREAFAALLQRYDASILLSCGGREIRTPEAVSDLIVFKTICFNRSHIPPCYELPSTQVLGVARADDFEILPHFLFIFKLYSRSASAHFGIQIVFLEDFHD
jgi:hypothetical protein